jgi:hypothetical protein
MMRKLAVGLLAASGCMAQYGEAGGGVGYGWYHNGSIISSGGTAGSGIRNRFTASVFLCEDLYDYFSGEVRYGYHDGDTFLQSGSAKGTVQAQSHTFTYDAMFHLKPVSQKIRPFFAAGGGAKYYVTTGPAPNPQPLPQIALLTTESQWKPVFDFGGGVRIRVTHRLGLRAEFRDYITTFPDKLFSPVAGATSRGIFHQFTPMFSIGYMF